MAWHTSTDSRAFQYGVLAAQTSGVLNSYLNNLIAVGRIDDEDREILQKACGMVQEFRRGKALVKGSSSRRDSTHEGSKSSLDAYCFAVGSLRPDPDLEESFETAKLGSINECLSLIEGVLNQMMGVSESAQAGQKLKHDAQLAQQFFAKLSDLTFAIYDQPEEDDSLFMA